LTDLLPYTFSTSLDPVSIANSITLYEGNQTINISTSLVSDNRSIIIFPSGVLKTNTWYKLVISESLKGSNQASFAGKEFSFKTILGVAPSYLGD
jgi:hypothetical protein